MARMLLFRDLTWSVVLLDILIFLLIYPSSSALYDLAPPLDALNLPAGVRLARTTVALTETSHRNCTLSFPLGSNCLTSTTHKSGTVLLLKLKGIASRISKRPTVTARQYGGAASCWRQLDERSSTVVITTRDPWEMVVSAYIYHLNTREKPITKHRHEAGFLEGYITYKKNHQAYLKRVDERTGLMATFSRMVPALVDMVVDYRYLRERAKHTNAVSEILCMNEFQDDYNGTVTRLAKAYDVNAPKFVELAQSQNVFHQQNTHTAHVHLDTDSLTRKRRLLEMLEDDYLARHFLDELRVLMEMSCVSKAAPPYHPYGTDKDHLGVDVEL
eukprot:m.179140 g.179140  ORF g.179140 m.179140 type:complete len:330 (-) comp16844_c0_seq1:3031-4020(-)